MKKKKFLIAVVFTFYPALACPVSDKLNSDIQTLENNFRLPNHLLYSLIKAESAFCNDATSPKGAVGLGQLLPSTANEMGLNAYNPQENIYAAAQYLRKQFDTFQNWTLALAAYNAGAGNVKKYGGIPPFKETQNYVSKILQTTQQLNGLKNTGEPENLSALLRPAAAKAPAQIPNTPIPNPIPEQANQTIYPAINAQKSTTNQKPITQKRTPLNAPEPTREITLAKTMPISRANNQLPASKTQNIIFESVSTAVITPASTRSSDRQTVVTNTPHLTVIHSLNPVGK